MPLGGRKGARMEAIGWPSAVVAVALIGLTAAIMIVAMKRYQFNEALQIWGALGSIIGVMVGIMASYFFTRSTVQDLQLRLFAAQLSEQEVEVRRAFLKSSQPRYPTERRSPWQQGTLRVSGDGTDAAIQTTQGKLKAGRMAYQNALHELAARVYDLAIEPEKSLGQLVRRDVTLRELVDAAIANADAIGPEFHDDKATVVVLLDLDQLWEKVATALKERDFQGPLDR